MEEKTAIEKIDEIYDVVKQLQKTMAVMDNNLKLLNSKANSTLFAEAIEFKTKNQSFPSPPQTSLQKIVMADLNDKQPQAGVALDTAEQPAYLQQVNSKVHGKIVNINGKPIHGANITVYNSTNKIVKNTKTNRAGVWISYLPPGKYSAKYEVSGSQPSQKIFEVIEGQQEINI